ncbi:uncharacterized protein [Procambarus clarkii]|uniref:uncharacterized protein n=1 Tax=Procambarus clarkii TaxID=6728 RepID=UPI001E676B88|nr:uncharacterized protein LOC123768579 [Procambarus clarkii]
MGTLGPRQRYLRRLWEAEAEAQLEEEEEQDVPREVAQYSSNTSRSRREAFVHGGSGNTHQQQVPPAGTYSALGAPPITFWTAHRGRVHGATSPGTSTSTFCRSASFTTPIRVALDPPAWPGWGT